MTVIFADFGTKRNYHTINDIINGEISKLGNATEEELLKSCEEEPQIVENWVRLSTYYLSHGRYEKTQEAVSKGLNVEQKARLYDIRGKVYELMGDKDRCFEAYAVAAELGLKEAENSLN